ncbi:hypothetical protein AXG93_4448s1290 [Marchantia polymorpha subsp. ruderalis]|uniref:Fe2OG dioxygenase domain-containing protein n=2 Tax=Marchantia polymorpha TaxID=3197 RepID=A0A176VCU7_MARPO|nr:hypothetical protein AXG93_4448s1290 [Marchantia polymorpha subsp. ruderalis]
MSSEDGVPVIDLADIQGPGLERICEQIAKASEEWGFFHIVNHGVDLDLIRRTQKAYIDFFHLPTQEKRKYMMTADFEGWSSPEVYNDPDLMKFGLTTAKTCEFMYHVALSRDPNQQPALSTIPPALRPMVLEFAKEVTAAQERVLAAMSVALGLDASALQNRFGPADVGIRANYYPLKREGKTVGELPAHSDLPAIVFLFADKVPGLEIRKDERWVRVKPVADAFVVNVADCLEVLSNGRFRSAEHRGAGSEAEERISMVSFYMPSKAATIGPMDELLDETHPARFRSANFGQMGLELLSTGLKGKGFVEALRIEG